MLEISISDFLWPEADYPGLVITQVMEQEGSDST